MPRQINLRREHVLRERAFREREGVFAAWVKWFVFDPVASQKDNVYDESGEKVYKGYATVPLLWWFDEEGGDRLSPEGRDLQRMMTVAITVGALRNAGIDPESDDRINDMVLFRGWYWEIIEIVFTSQSSLVSPDEDHHGDDSTARVTLVRRFTESDMPYDMFLQSAIAPSMTVNGVAPNPVAIGAVVLTVTGTGFTPDCIALIDPGPGPVVATFVSSTSLTVDTELFQLGDTGVYVMDAVTEAFVGPIPLSVI